MSISSFKIRHLHCLQIFMTFLGFLLTPALLAQTTLMPTLHVQPDQKKTIQKQVQTLHLDLSEQAIQNSGSPTMTTLIQNQGIAHIQPGSGNPNQTMISMDGFGNNASSNSLILIDGIPFTSFTNIGPNLNAMILSNIQSLTVIPGSQGVLYGNQAVSGVVDIQTRQPENPIFVGNLGLGNQGQIVAGYYGSDRPNPQWGYNVGIQTDYTHHDLAYNAQQNTNFNLNVHHYGTGNTTSANLIHYADSAQAPSELIFDSPQVIGNPEKFSMTGTMAYLTNQHHFHAQDDLQTHFAVYQTHLDIAYLNNAAWQLGDQIDQKGLFISNQWHHAQHLMAGLDDQYNAYQHRQLAPQDHAQGNILSPYIRKQFQISPKLTSILGVRYANQYLNAQGSSFNINEFNQAWANEESITDHLMPSLQITLRHDSSYAFATGKDVLWRFEDQAPLKTQTGDQYNLDIHFENDHVTNLISFYEINLQNELAIRFDAENGMSEIYNLPSTRRLGVNYINQWHLNQQWILKTQLSYVDPRLTYSQYDNKIIPAVSLWNGSMGIHYQTKNNWLAGIEETIHSSFYAAFDLNNQGAQLPGYALTNLHIQKQTPMITYDLSVNNVFNRHDISYANYSPTHNLIYYYPSDGISILLHLSFNLLPNIPDMIHNDDE
jgi:iron complex outermembrane receptor protein